MQASEPLQFDITKRLNAEADTVHPGVPVCTQRVDGDRLGIGFEGDFARRVERKAFAARAHEPSNLLARQQRRGAAAKIDRIGRRLRFRGAPDLRLEGRHVPGLERGVEQTSIEVAVVADGGAERDMEIKTQHR
jgi:hypothetical protein